MNSNRITTRRLILIIGIVFLSSSLALAADDTTIKAETTTSKGTTPTTTSTSTTKETTTPKETTTTPTTTTAKTTTSTTTTTTTTTPATTAKPDVVPAWPKNVGHWFANDTKDPKVLCLVLDAAFEINVPYENDKNKTVTGVIDIPPHAVGNGSCIGTDEAELSITWPVTKGGSGSNELELHFRKYNDSKNQGKEIFALSQINLTITPDFSDAKENNTLSFGVTFKDEETRFRTPVNKSYTCTKEPSIKVETVELKVGKLQVEAFHPAPFDKFSAEFECVYDDVSAVVPFAVGASLALLVLIVLIAYLIGRRRSRARGYQSV